jgi:alpha-tubulin suppressor-like RCC1 family protein
MSVRSLYVTSCLIAVASCSEPSGPPSIPPGTFGSVAGGFRHTCALLGGGAAYCWGFNASLALGTGSANDRDSVPRAVAGNRTFTVIDAGEGHSCAITTAGAAYCWGASNDGALGSDTASVTPFPVPVDGGLTFKTITTGRSFTCGLTTAGAAYCWGLNDWGQLGRDTSDTRTPVAVSGGHIFTALAAGDYHTCGIATGGAAYCWGSNTFGTLGTGDTTTRSRHPVPELVAGGLHFRSIDAGNTHTCAVATNSAAYCWGANAFRQLGTGSESERRTPGLVTGNHPFSTVSVGTNHTCGLDVDGFLWCWGSNGAAQLAATPTESCIYGPGPSDNLPCTSTPLLVAGMVFQKVSVGGFHTCAIHWEGGAFCWGGNTQGQIGNGQVGGNTALPARVADPVVIAPAS